MIKIKKPKKAPSILSTKGKNKTDKFKQDYDNGVRTFEFDKKVKIYGHTTVKKLLLSVQYEKCCFCEKKVEEMECDIEHFRPKAGYKQSEKDKISETGYYWLAYDWDNLLLCCATCNRRNKGNLFPLMDSTKRAKSHHDNIQDETPIFINPAKENPTKHISYNGDAIYSKTDRGKTTITALGLDRPFLNERKLKIYQEYKLVFQTIQILPNSPLKTQLQQLLINAQKDDAEYALMIRCAIKNKFRY